MARGVTLKQDRAVRRVVDMLRGDRLRQFITLRSEKNLQRQAVDRPTPTRAFLKNLLRLERLAVPITKVVFPESLSKLQNRELFGRLGEMGYLFGLIDGNGVLDLRRAGLKRNLGYHDLTLEFEEYAILKELRGSFQDEENHKVLKKDVEISDLTLYYNLWVVRILLYKVGELRAVAKREGNPTAEGEALGIMVSLAKFLGELSRDFGELYKGFSAKRSIPLEKISRAASLLKEFNNPAANATLVPITDQLDKLIETQEGNRIQRERRSGKRPPKNMLEEELVRLAERRYKISFSPDGIWVIPQGGFRRQGPVRQKQIIDHHVDAEKVARRTQHIIDSITEGIAVNAHFRAMLEGFVEVLRYSTTIDYEQVLNGLAKSFLAYENGIVRPKFKTKLVLKLALELVRTASVCRDQKAERRLLNFAGSMLRMAAGELVVLNGNLAVQLERLAVKKKLVTEIVARNLVRDANLRTFSGSLVNSLTNSKMMNSIGMTGQLRQLAVDVADALEIDEQSPTGMRRTGKRIKELVKLLAKVRRLILEKDNFRRNFIRARIRYTIELDNIKAARKSDIEAAQEELESIKQRYQARLAALREKGIKYAQEKLESIKEHNANIAETLGEAAKEALLIQYNLVNKYVEEDEEAQISFLAEHQEIFDRIKQMDAVYLTVYGSRGEDLGTASSFDVWRLGLTTRPKSS
ncbi:MAG: hypothetical protein ABIH22_00990 [Candidatus Margulisiibacteriota bacterium]